MMHFRGDVGLASGQTCKYTMKNQDGRGRLTSMSLVICKLLTLSTCKLKYLQRRLIQFSILLGSFVVIFFQEIGAL